MDGVTIIETKAIQDLIKKIESLQETVLRSLDELKDAKKPYLDIAEVMELTGFKRSWVNVNKSKIGFCSVEGSIRFKRSDVDAFMNLNYFKSK